MAEKTSNNTNNIENIGFIPENINIVGTSHIAKESIMRIDRAIKEFSADFIAVELDKGRYAGLINDERPTFRLNDFFKNIKIIGFSGYFFALIGSWVSGRLGKLVNMEPGADMLHAIKKGQEKNIRIALIDQDIKITLSRFSKYLTFNEKIRIVKDVFLGLLFPKKEAKKMGINFNLSKIPSDELISIIISNLRKRYPNIYKVLIHERNIYMAKRLKALSNKGKVIAIVGAGHKEGIEKYLFGKYEKTTYSFTLS